jgi:hypothetical protein
MLIATDSDGKTTWQRAVECGSLDVLQKIWDLTKDIITTQ